MNSTATSTALRMWALVEDGHIIGVFNSRNAARAQRLYNGGTVKRALVSLI